ncbi:MAG: hypothetical protein KKF36_05200 [Alphaproteobacteria bacterium]|nr:hypothetical protein [Alphaproteobacteria bacterium]
MHILLGLLTLLAGIGVWVWRLRMARQGLDAAADIARTVANAPRRLAFRYKAGQGGLDLIDDPREAAAIMMMQVALARGGRLTGRQSDVIEAEIREHFDYTPGEAEDLAAHAAWVSQTCPPARDTMTRLSRMIVNSPRLGPKEVVDLDAMLVAVSEAEELPSRAQLLLLQVYRDTAGLKT